MSTALTPCRFAPTKLALTNEAPSRVAWDRFAFERSAGTPQKVVPFMRTPGQVGAREGRSAS